MAEVTRILEAIDEGNPHAAEELLPAVYDELRRLAHQKLSHEKPGQTLQATALVHDAYLRLIGPYRDAQWNNRGHFFAAAAEAMRRILVENARRKRQPRRGGGRHRVPLEDADVPVAAPLDDLLAVHEALTRLESRDADAARLIKLRYFAGLTMPEAAAALGLPLRTAERTWTYARAWLHRELAEGESDERR